MRIQFSFLVKLNISKEVIFLRKKGILVLVCRFKVYIELRLFDELYYID